MVNRKRGCFVTGTDTGVGKTLVAGALLKLARDAGLTTAALKPVAAGVTEHSGKMVNEDAIVLQALSTSNQSYEEINPILLDEPIAPHIAAKAQGTELTLNALVNKSKPVIENQNSDFIVVEGAGGWLVPIDEENTLADYAQAIDLRVVLVVGMKLGCLNHAMLTVDSIIGNGLTLAGWVGSLIDPDMLAVGENIDTLLNRIPSPCLGIVDFLPTPSVEIAASFISIEELIA